ncbi:lipopolysaccharide biosynthesis protein [Candidatus Methylomicrobium oryzae]|uniref:lipopolysaccharide biosynthesis protein n=1 Tax=Candidatus Methylomicrobium oryzae TaxID=2802053 RepID=UPI0019245EF4|nr:lipopolysaccharide biosynthesis protein [Methylomicrobium sp. RS1]MBL1264994.1 lipopolysaccharide biosynthesis protein [Methylomicrobium sp. RS1]
MQKDLSIRKNTLWLFAGNITQRVLELLFSILLARLLLPSDFGLLITTQVFTGVAGFIAGGGMGQALIQAKKITQKHFHVVFTIQLGICVSIYAAFFLAAPWIAVWFDKPIYSDLLRVSALNFLIRPFLNISSSKLKREMRFKSISVLSLVSLIVSSTCSVLLAFYDYGVWSLIFGGLIGSLFMSISLIILSQCYPAFAFDSEIAKSLGTYGFKFSINDIVEYLRLQIPNFLLGKFMGSQTVGLFNKGYSLSEYPVLLIAGSTYQTVFRALSSTQDNFNQSKYIYLRTITLVCVYTYPFYIGLLWLADPFVTILYGENWRPAVMPLQILCISQMLRCFGNGSGAVIAAQNILGTEIKIQSVTFFLVGLGCWYGIQQNDIAMIAWGMLPGSIFLYIGLAYCACKRLKVTLLEFSKAIAPALFLSTLLASALGLIEYGLNHYNIELKPLDYMISFTAIGGMTYGLLFLFCPIASLKTERDRWKKKLLLQF